MDLYIVLGVARAASGQEIKRAYKRLARKYHPDINPGDRMAAQHFRQIAEAYETLSDPDRRRQYDAGGAAAEHVQPPTFGFEGFDFTASVSGSSAPTFGDLFAEALRSGAAPASRPVGGADLHQTVSITLEEAVSGGTRDIVLTRQERCHVCQGMGRVQAPERPCGHCQGAGSVRSVRGHMVFSRSCHFCGGTGRQASIRCGACGGRQFEMRAETLRVDLRPGVSDGDQLRVPGKGHAGRHGGEYGDLHLTIEVRPHPLFRRDGNDLHVTVPIAVHEAALGAKVDVPAIDGRPARLRVPPGTQSGQRFRLRERGAPSARDGRRGDLVVELRLVLPTFLDERSKALLREFGRLNTEDVRGGLPR
jgi:molecular chaperone DnaJ